MVSKIVSLKSVMVQLFLFSFPSDCIQTQTICEPEELNTWGILICIFALWIRYCFLHFKRNFKALGGFPPAKRGGAHAIYLCVFLSQVSRFDIWTQPSNKPIQACRNEQQGDTAAVKLVLLHFGVVPIQVSEKEEAMKAALCSTGLLWWCLIAKFRNKLERALNQLHFPLS